MSPSKLSPAKAEKIDLFRQFKDQYATPKTPTLVGMPPAYYLTITGQGEPGGEVFSLKMGALYGAAYGLKFAHKKAGPDYKIAPLEGLWWGVRGGIGFLDEHRSTWQWRLLIRTPEFIGRAELDASVDVLIGKGKGPELRDVSLEWIEEGTCVQVLHVGPYSEESKTLAAMEEFAAARGLKPHGLHHEIYLSDPRRVPPERLRTILRMPVQ